MPNFYVAALNEELGNEEVQKHSVYFLPESAGDSHIKKKIRD